MGVDTNDWRPTSDAGRGNNLRFVESVTTAQAHLVPGHFTPHDGNNTPGCEDAQMQMGNGYSVQFHLHQAIVPNEACESEHASPTTSIDLATVF